MKNLNEEAGRKQGAEQDRDKAGKQNENIQGGRQGGQSQRTDRNA